jgi:hypothetical protein
VLCLQASATAAIDDFLVGLNVLICGSKGVERSGLLQLEHMTIWSNSLLSDWCCGLLWATHPLQLTAAMSNCSPGPQNLSRKP